MARRIGERREGRTFGRRGPALRQSSAAAAQRRRMARKSVSILPTLFTLGNLLCGFIAIFIASRQGVTLPFNWSPQTGAAIFIFIGMAFDGVDGGIARLTRSHSELGAHLDSMADMVTFGVAPAFLAIQLVGVQLPFFAADDAPDTYFYRLAFVVACIYAACAALRLARFNVELATPGEHDHEHFRGLPSPGAAGTVASLALLHEHFLIVEDSAHWTAEAARVFTVGIMLLAALAMVSQFRYVHVLNRYVRGRAPVDKMAKLIIVLLLLLIHWQGALAAAFALYALSAPGAATYRWMRGRR